MPKAQTKIIDGKFLYSLTDQKKFQKFIEKMEGRDVIVTIERLKHTDKQRALYWVFVDYCVKQGLGDQTPELLNETFKEMFITPKYNIKTKKFERKSTKKLNTKEYSTFFDQCLLLAGEHIDVTEFVEKLEKIRNEKKKK